MKDALAAGEALISEGLSEKLGESPTPGPVDALLAWARENPGLADFYFDPSRAHPEVISGISDPLAASFAPADATEGFENVRTLWGLFLRSSGAEMIEEGHWTPRIMELYSQAVARVDAATYSRRTTMVDRDELLAELAKECAADNESERHELVRHHSALMLIDGGTVRWNFRSLAETSGIALAALHAMGSRQQHIHRSTVDIAVSLLNVALQQNRNGATPNDVVAAVSDLPLAVAAYCESMLGDTSAVLGAQGLEEILERAARQTPEADMCLKPAMIPHAGMVASVLISAYHRRVEQPDAWIAAPSVASEFIRATAGV